MSSTERAKAGVKSAAAEAESAGRQVQNSKSFQLLVMVGLMAYGLVHLLVAWIAVQIAWTGSRKEASQRGALSELAGSGFGDVLLWITAVGLFALALWQLFTAIWGHQEVDDDKKKVVKRLGSAGKAVIYLALGVSAVSTVISGGKSSSSSEKSMTAKVLSVPFGKVLVIAVGLAIVVMGGRLVYRGAKKKFVKDLTGGVTEAVTRLGQVGYIAKGIAFAIVGVLFCTAAINYDPNKAGGLDSALRTLRSQPYGSVLLTLMALGIAAFGVFCFVWSRHAKR